MLLNTLLQHLPYEDSYGKMDIEINTLQYDSRKVQKGDVFFAIRGYTVDGHDYIEKAVEKGASVIFCEKEIKPISACTIIQVKDARKALAQCAATYYDFPSNKMKVIGITGTNGKTTSAFMVKEILEAAGYKVGLIGTIVNYIGTEKVPAHRTTPESLELQELFKRMVDQGVHYCVMEVSSHSLSLDRVYGIRFAQSIFTNLTQDHLDFHETFENYFEAKQKLFHYSKTSIINQDDEYGRRILEGAIDTVKVSYGIDHSAEVMAKNIQLHARGAAFQLVSSQGEIEIDLGIPGKYNVYNALGTAAICLQEGISLEKVKAGLEKVQVPGRCEIVTREAKLGFEVIVDYAHSPDGLENILKTAREFTEGRLISVFGCGGDRDKTKRPIMGRIGSELSDFVIITSDNPRTEDPFVIIEEVVAGMEKENYEIVENRKEAIEKAMLLAKPGDVIVVAGKGHEDYQVLKDKTIHFDEREVIAEIIKERF